MSDKTGRKHINDLLKRVAKLEVQINQCLGRYDDLYTRYNSLKEWQNQEDIDKHETR